MPALRKANIIGGCVLAVAVVLLAVILFPIFTFRPDRTRLESCLSNEQQIGLAIFQYAQDFDEKFPCGLGQKGPGWAGQILEYARTPGLFHCPDDLYAAKLPDYPVSYGYNLNIVRRHGKVPFAQLSAKTVLLFEITGNHAQIDKVHEGVAQGAISYSAVGDGTDGSLRAGDVSGVKYATGYMGKRAVPPVIFQFEETGRHYGGSNFLFGDGHAQFLTPDRVSTGTDAKNTKDNQTGGVVGRSAGTDYPAYDATFSTR